MFFGSVRLCCAVPCPASLCHSYACACIGQPILLPITHERRTGKVRHQTKSNEINVWHRVKRMQADGSICQSHLVYWPCWSTSNKHAPIEYTCKSICWQIRHLVVTYAKRDATNVRNQLSNGQLIMQFGFMFMNNWFIWWKTDVF